MVVVAFVWLICLLVGVVKIALFAFMICDFGVNLLVGLWGCGLYCLVAGILWCLGCLLSWCLFGWF